MAVVVAVTGKWNGKELTAAQAQLEAIKRQSMGTFASMSASLKATGARMTATGRTLSTRVTLPLVGLGYVATRAASDYGSAMTQVQAASGASGKQMDLLKRQAMGMAEGFGVSATDAAMAIEDLVKAGLTPAQVAAGGLEQAMTLAATGELAAGDASTILANSLAAYHIKATDAVTITDSLVAAANATTASVSSLAQGLGNVGPVAASAGMSIADTAAALGALDQQGIKAAEGGTALKTFLLRLVPQTDAAATAMSDLGVKFTDAKGNIKPMTQVVGQLQKGTEGLTKAQQQQALTTIFGTRGILAANALMNTGKKKLEEYEAATKKQGDAQKLLNKQRETEKFQLEQAKAAMQNAAITLGGALAPAITAVAGVVADLAKWFSNLSPKTQDLIVKAGLIAAALGPVISIIGALVTGLGLVLSPVGLAIAAIVAIGIAVVVAYKKFEGFRNVVDTVWSAIKAATANAWAYIQDTIFPAMKKVWGYIVPVLKTIWTVWKFYFKAIWTTVKTVWGAIKPYVQTAMKMIGAYVKTGVAVIGFAFDKIRDFVNLVRNNFSQIVSAVREKIAAAVDFVRKFPGRIKDFFVNSGKWLYDAGVDMIQGLIDGAGSLLSKMGEFMLDKLPGWIVGPFKKAMGISSPSKVMMGLGRFLTDGLIEGIKEGTKSVAEASKKMAEAAQNAAVDALDTLEDKLDAKVRSIQSKMREMVSSVTGAFTSAGAIGSVFSTEEGAPGITDALKSQVAVARTFASQIKRLRKQGLNRGAISQILGMGATDGSAAAAQLLGNKNAIGSVNQSQRQLRRFGQQTGQFLANDRYGSDLGAAKSDLRAVKQTNVRVEKGSVIINFGADAGKGDRQTIKKVVEHAIDKAMKELARELRSA